MQIKVAVFPGDFTEKIIWQLKTWIFYTKSFFGHSDSIFDQIFRIFKQSMLKFI